MNWLGRGCVAALSLAVIATIHCGPVPAQTDTKTQPSVTIQAPRGTVDDRVHSFVQGITRDARFYGESVPRWRAPLCFLVAGLPRAQGEFVVGRLSQVASAAGARLAPQGCRPNLHVVFTRQPDRLVNEWYARDRRFFADSSPTEIERFLHPSQQPQPVRAWYNAELVKTGGVPLSTHGSACDGANSNVAISCLYSTSRLTWSELLDLSSVVVVVDTERANGFELGPVADYIAMVGLADINLEADVGDTPTILQLFSASDKNRPPGLSTWDQAFLHALYHSEQESKGQRSQIAVRMLHDVSP